MSAISPAHERPVPEPDLVAGLRRGDPGCTATFVRTYGGPMLSVARRMLRHEEDARDCVQEAMIQALRQIDGFEGRAALRTWLHRIVVNRALMRLRTRASRAEESLDELMPQFDETGHLIGPTEMPEVSIEDLIEQNDVRRLVRAAIDRLPDGMRTIVMLRDVEGYDTEEVAGMLGISTGAAKVRLHRARNALRKLLEPVLLRRAQ
jgi:RNA polymerase sigma-70 factor, ECF subfamily